MNIDPKATVLGVMACPPVDWTRLKLMLPGVELVAPAAGSTQTNCLTCAEKVWLGPEQQKQKQKHPQTVVMCFVCAVKMQIRMEKDNTKFIVRHLDDQGGSTYKVTDLGKN